MPRGGLSGATRSSGVRSHDAGLSGIELAVQMQQVVRIARFSCFPGSSALRIPMREEMGGHRYQLLAKPLEPVLLTHEVRRILNKRGNTAGG